MVQLCEGRHARVFVEAADQVAGLPDDGRLVLVAGPSSSGKSSFAKRLMVQLRVLGYSPFALSLDDYFVDGLVAELGRGREAAIPILQAIQTHYRYLPEEALRRVAELTYVPHQDYIRAKLEARSRVSPAPGPPSGP